MRMPSVPLSRPTAATSRSGRLLRARLGFLAATVAWGFLLLPAVPADADLPSGTSWTATVNGTNVERTTGRNPVTLVPGRAATVVVAIQNGSRQPFKARYVRLEGSVLGLTFYAYTTQVDFEIAPGGTDGRKFPVDLLDLGTQASGLIPSQIALLDTRGDVISAHDMRVDVRGNANSVYSVFGMAIGAVALTLLTRVLWQLATGRLSPNRWRRGLAVAAVGLGLGFLITFTLSALRIASPEATLWTSLLLGGAVLGFVAGYLSPNPGEAEEPAEDSAGLEAGGEEEYEPNVVADVPPEDDRLVTALLTEGPAEEDPEPRRRSRWPH